MQAPRRINLAFVLGTRPEAVKLSSLITQARASPDVFGVHVVNTGQHREILDGMLEWFDIKCDADLRIMQKSPRVGETAVTARDARRAERWAPWSTDALEHHRLAAWVDRDWLVSEAPTGTNRLSDRERRANLALHA